MATPALNSLREGLSQIVSRIDRSAIHGQSGSWVIYCVAGFFLFVVVWATVFKLDEITRGSGRIIPSSEVKVVQHLEGGVIKSIKVRIGDKVEIGDELVELDPRRQQSALEDVRSELRVVAVEILRNEALLNGSALAVPPEISRAVDMAAHTRAYESELARYSAEVGALDAEIRRLESERLGVERALEIARGDETLVHQSLNMARRLESTGAVSEQERIREEREALGVKKERQRLEARLQELAQQSIQANARRSAIVQQYRAERWARLSDLYAKKTALSSRLEAAEDGFDRSVVRSPVAGLVKNVFVNAVGSVAQAGAPLAEIVPIEDDLLVEVHILPQDIGFINLGQKAILKVSAFDFARFGAMQGVVEHISADSIVAKDREYYVVRIRIKDGFKTVGLAIKSGMTVNADIVTGRKTVMEYLAKPVIRGVNEALTER